ncbi:MAG: fold metallo-hydrolase [Candidatus Taylorbacteria bacterium]|nr:fold metallo-hydrolase [Candidatus Taylorbacteria bacterium]
MKNTYIIVIVLIILIVAAIALNKSMGGKNPQTANKNLPVQVTPIMHATAMLNWGGTIIYTDPTDAKLLAGQPKPNIILVTDIHSDHFSTTTLSALMSGSTSSPTLIVPQAVKDLLTPALAAQAKVLKNGETMTEQGFAITGVPMYNLPESPTSPHTKGRGNGYLIERGGFRVYVAGDTAGTPEMRALRNIDIAFIPMNLPYTMSVDEAADAVLAFKPKHVYPYHYRGQDGLSDVGRFKELVNAGDPNIDVILMNWYPKQ